MALKNVVPNSYAVIDHVFVEYAEQSIQFKLLIYRDDQKKELLMQANYSMHGVNDDDLWKSLDTGKGTGDSSGWVFCQNKKLMSHDGTPRPDCIPSTEFTRIFQKGNVLGGCYELIKARGVFPDAEDC